MTKNIFLKEMVSGIGNMVAPLDVGEIFTVITKDDRMFPIKIETNYTNGNGNYQITGRPSIEAKEAVKNVYNYIKANAMNMGVFNKLSEQTYITQIIDENGSGGNQEIGAAYYLSMISNFIDRPIKAKTVVLGSMTVNGNLVKTTNVYEKLSFIVEQGAKTVYIPISNQPETMTIQPDIWSKLSILFYASAEDLSRKVFDLE